MKKQTPMDDPEIPAQAKHGANSSADAESKAATNNTADATTDGVLSKAAAPIRPSENGRSRVRILTRTELEALRARLQKQFH